MSPYFLSRELLGSLRIRIPSLERLTRRRLSLDGSSTCRNTVAVLDVASAVTASAPPSENTTCRLHAVSLTKTVPLPFASSRDGACETTARASVKTDTDSMPSSPLDDLSVSSEIDNADNPGEAVFAPCTAEEHDAHVEADGWSVSAALQYAFPPTPTITGYRPSRALSTSTSSWHHYVPHDLLLVPERRVLRRILNTFPTTPHYVQDEHAHSSNGVSGALPTSSSTLLSDDVLQLADTPSPLLSDLSSLPSRAGVRLPLPAHAPPVAWTEEVEKPEVVQDREDRLAHVLPSDNCIPLSKNFADLRKLHGGDSDSSTRNLNESKTLSSTAAATALAVSGDKEEQAAPHTVWSPCALYHKVQACAEASPDALRDFTLTELGQRVPALLFLAEKPYVTGDEAAQSRVVLSTGATNAARVSTPTADHFEEPINKSSPSPQRAVASARRVPVEAYAERTWLARTTGTAALQLALGRAVASADWYTHPPPENHKDGRSSHADDRTKPQKPHLVWTDDKWAVESDNQLVSMEEELLRCIRSQNTVPKASGTMCTTTPSIALQKQGDASVRAWLPSRWIAGHHLQMQPLTHEDETDNALYLNASFDNSTHNLASFSSSLSRHGVPTTDLPARSLWRRVSWQMPSCSSWTFRLRKSWLVTGLSQATQPFLATRSLDDNSSGYDSNVNLSSTTDLKEWGHCIGRSSLLQTSKWSYMHWARQPNYNLQTGLPLNLMWYRAGLFAKSKQRRQRQDTGGQTTPASMKAHRIRRSKSKAGSASRASETADDDVIEPFFSNLKDGGEGVKQSFFLADKKTAGLPPGGLNSELTLLPFSCAALSKRVGWVQVEKCTRDMASRTASDSAAGWSLPSTFPSFALPENAEAVRMPLLTDRVTRTLATSGEATTPAMSTTPAADATEAADAPPEASEPPFFAGVTLPQQEWFTGFFAHDAPAWWVHVLTTALGSTPDTPISHQKRTDALNDTISVVDVRHDATNHSSKAVTSLHGEGKSSLEYRNTSLVRRLMQKGYLPLLPEEAPGDEEARKTFSVTTKESATATNIESKHAEKVQAATAVAAAAHTPTVHVLRLKSAPPAIYKTAEKNKINDNAKEVTQELYWSSFDGSSSEGTVNFVYTLQDVLRMQEETTRSDPLHKTESNTPEQPPNVQKKLLFIEVKAAFEVMRRVFSSVDAFTVDQQESSSTLSWWPVLSAFHNANTIAMHHDKDQGTLDLDSMHPRPSAEPPTCETKASQSLSSNGKEAGSCSAYAHPTPAEVVRAFVRLVKHNHKTCSSTLLKRCNKDDVDAERNRSRDLIGVQAAAAGDFGKTGHGGITSWARADYGVVWREVLNGTTACTTPATEGWDDANVLAKGDQSSDAAANNTNHGIVDLGTSNPRTWRRRKSGVGFVRVNSEDGVHPAPPLPSPPPQLPYGVQVHFYDQDGTRLTDTTNAEVETRKNNNTTSSGGAAESPDWPAVDRRLFAKRDHRLEDAMQNPANTFSSVVKKQLKHAETLANFTGDVPSTVPIVFFPEGPPVAVAALGVRRAAALVAAQDEGKRHGYLPVARQRSAQPPGTRAMVSTSKCTNSDNSAKSTQLGQRETEADTACGENQTEDGEKKDEDDLSCNATAGHAIFPASTETTLRNDSERGDRTKFISSASSCARTSFDLIDILIEEEVQRFHRLWRPWLKYLPPVYPLSSNDVATFANPALMLDSMPLTMASDPRPTFRFLRSSRLSACCSEKTRQEKDQLEASRVGESDACKPTHTSINKNEEEVHAHELGLCVLHIKYDEYYINAYNLLYREDVVT